MMAELRRTLRGFVEDMVTNDYNLKRILTIAQNTHWRGREEEIKEIHKKIKFPNRD